MQIQAINLYNNISFSASKGRHRVTTKPKKEMTNEEILAAAKPKKRPIHFTPSQQALFPLIEDFKESETLDTLKLYLEDAQMIDEDFEKSKRGFCVIEQSGIKYFCHKDEDMIKIAAKDNDANDIYSYTKITKGGYSKYSIKSEFDNQGKVELTRQGKYGNFSFFVNNLDKEHYYFAGDIKEDNEIVVDYIKNFNC